MGTLWKCHPHPTPESHCRPIISYLSNLFQVVRQERSVTTVHCHVRVPAKEEFVIKTVGNVILVLPDGWDMRVMKVIYNFKCSIAYKEGIARYHLLQIAVLRNWVEHLRRVEYEKRLLLRSIHHFKSDLINNMDHMRISGTEPSSVILGQTKLFKKLKSDVQKVSSQSIDAKEMYRGMFETQKSGNNTRSGEICLDIRTHTSP